MTNTRTKSKIKGRDFGLRSAFVAAVEAGYAPADGTVVTADGLSYLRKSGETVLPGLAGWLPIDATPKHFGAVGDGVADDTDAFKA